MVVAIGAYASITSDDFRTTANLTNLSRQMVVLGLASLAQFVVVLARGVDLSVGASVRLASIVAAIVMDGSDGRFVLGVLAAIGVSLVIGAVNGVTVATLNVATVHRHARHRCGGERSRAVHRPHPDGPLVTMVGRPLRPHRRPDPRARAARRRHRRGAVGAARPTPAGVGTSTPWAATLTSPGSAGCASTVITVSAYMLAGVLAGMAGVVLIGGTGVGDSSAAAALEFESLAVVVIGGASLAGGRGRLVGVLGGVVLFSMLGNVFNLLKVEVWYQQLVRGAVILVAAALYVQRQPKPDAAPQPTSSSLHRSEGSRSWQ